MLHEFLFQNKERDDMHRDVQKSFWFYNSKNGKKKKSFNFFSPLPVNFRAKINEGGCVWLITW